ncbi:MaoC family dehydratase [Streptomyces sp. NPDC051572]|uniref:MaoC family dehydratase n=1 Tax=unclassified Streptomyces TaxID=2593676 RepID=UPI00344DC7DD
MKVTELTVGDSRTDVVVAELSRTRIVMYAGASGDFNPLHTDEVYATETAGYAGVLAHGQLTMGLTAKLVTQWLDEAELMTFGVRFRSQVWPGDTLITTATVASVDAGPQGPEAELSLRTTNADGREVVTGYARLRDAVSTAAAKPDAVNTDFDNAGEAT